MAGVYLFKNSHSHRRYIHLSFFVFLFFGFFFAHESAWATTPPPIITYQGKILESNQSVTTTKAMGFLLYDASTGGNLVYTAAGTLSSTSTINVTPSQGIFSIDLGGSGTNAIATSTFANYHTLYLEVVFSGQVLTPRKRLTSVPYAINSEYLSGIAATNTSSTTYIPTSDDFGNFLFSGNSRGTGATQGLISINPSSTISNGTLFGASVGNTERFKLDTSGNVFASGTLLMAGLSTLSGGFLSSASSSINSTLTVSSALNASTSLFVKDNIFVNQTAGTYNQGRFFVDSSGNLAASGTVNIHGTSTFRDLVEVKGKVLAPRHVGSIVDGTDGASLAAPRTVTVYGNYAYVTDNNTTDSFQIFDISDPINISRVGTLLDDTGGAQFTGPVSTFVQGGFAYVISSDGLEVVDVSDPSNPRHAGGLRNGDGGAQLGTVTRGFVSGMYAYVVSGQTGSTDALEIIDISNPRRPRHAGVITEAASGVIMNSPQSVYVSGNYAYVASNISDSLEIIDVSDPTNPRHVTSTSHGVGGALLNGAQSVVVQGNYAYVAANVSDALEIIDVSSSTNPVHVGSLSDGVGGALLDAIRQVKIRGKYVYAITTNEDALEIIDVSSSTNPVHAGSLLDNTGGSLLDETINDFDVKGNYAYFISTTDDALSVVDISGTTISNAEIGGLKVGEVDVMGEARFDQNINARGGLSVGSNGFLLSGDFGMSAPTTSMNATNTLRFSHRAYFSASSTNGYNFIFDATSTPASSTSNYIFSVRNKGVPHFSISTNGDGRFSGSILASSSAIGTPGSPGDLAERVDIAIDDVVEPGDVMIVDPGSRDTYRRSGHAYDHKVAGVISTNPTIVVGNGRTDYTAVMAMVGRVPVKVSTENGAIERGDLLVAASTTGYAMRYDPLTAPRSVPIGVIGVALDSLSVSILETSSSTTSTTSPSNPTLTTGSIMALIRTGWVNTVGETVAELSGRLSLAASEASVMNDAPESLSVAESDDGEIVWIPGATHNLRGGELINVARIVGNENLWEIDRYGQLVSRVETSNGTVNLYASSAADAEYILSGSSVLSGGEARIDFDEKTREIIDRDKPIVVTITLTGEEEAGDVRVVEKNATGFTVKEIGGGGSNVGFDWVVRARRRVPGTAVEGEETVPEGGEEQILEEEIEMEVTEEVVVGETDGDGNDGNEENRESIEENSEENDGDEIDNTEELIGNIAKEETEIIEATVNEGSNEEIAEFSEQIPQGG